VMSIRSIRLCTLVCMIVAGVPARADDPVQVTRTNPILLNYFRNQLIGADSHAGARGRRRFALDPRSVNQHASALAEDFLSQVTRKLDALRDGFENVQHARSEALLGSVRFKPGVQARWSASLKKVSDEAGDLHGMLNLVFDGVDSKGPSMPEIDSRSLGSGFEKETEMMGDQILRADRRIREFLSGERFSISVDELRDEDMLMLLSRVQAEAKEMRRTLDAVPQLGAESSRRIGD